jgi:hypothetical protein
MSNWISATPLFLQPTKTGGWSLRADFLRNIAELFHADVFIESGTSYGSTVNAAQGVFNEIHTIELDHAFYVKACARFAQERNVYLYEGDSGELLADILSTLKERKIVCWLDGHYSGGTTAKGELNTPILKELKALENAHRSDAIILIDDVCCFRPDIQKIPDIALGYPTIIELKQAILQINPHYRFIIYGDIAIAFPPEYAVEISPLIEGMTISRLFDRSRQSYDDLFVWEGIIASKTTPAELEALWDNCTYHFGWHRAYAYLWYALSLFTAERYAEAYDNFIHVLESGYTHWRVSWYAMQAAYRSGKDYMRFTPALMECEDKEFASTRLFLEAIK